MFRIAALVVVAYVTWQIDRWLQTNTGHLHFVLQIIPMALLIVGAIVIFHEDDQRRPWWW